MHIGPEMGGWMLDKQLYNLLRMRMSMLRKPTEVREPQHGSELELHRCYSAFNIFGVVLSSMAWLFAFSGESGGWSAEMLIV